MRFSTIAVALAASAAAAPSPAASPVPPKNKEFYIAFTVAGYQGKPTYISANAVANGTAKDLVIVGERLSVYPGTPAFFNASSTSKYGKALNFDLTGSKNKNTQGVYGLIAPDVGDNYGFAGNIVATRGQQQPAWSSYNGSISHQLYAATNAFFACNATVNGQAATVLRFGVFNSNGRPPKNCQTTQVVQNFNVPGGAPGPK